MPVFCDVYRPSLFFKTSTLRLRGAHHCLEVRVQISNAASGYGNQLPEIEVVIVLVGHAV